MPAASRPRCSPPGWTRIAGRDATAFFVMDDGRRPSLRASHPARRRKARNLPRARFIRPHGSCDCAQDDARGWRGDVPLRRSCDCAQDDARRWRGDVPLCRSRKGAVAPRREVRVRSDGVCAGWPRASSGLDGPTMPTPLQKFAEIFPRECCLRASHAWHGEAGSLFCEVKEEPRRRPAGDTNKTSSPGESCLTRRASQSTKRKTQIANRKSPDSSSPDDPLALPGCSSPCALRRSATNKRKSPRLSTRAFS